MTAEPSVRDRAAEFIAAHDPEDGHCEASCSCGVTIGEFAEGWSIHLANALAAAGLLAGEAEVESVQVARLAFVLRDVDQPYQQSAEEVAQGLYRAGVRVKATR